MKRRTFLAGLFLVSAPAVLLLPSEKKAKLQGYDVLSPGYSAVTLRAKLERQGALGVNPDLEGVEIAFRLAGKEIGRAKTGDEGLASLDWTPPNQTWKPDQQPEFEFEAALPPGADWSAGASRFRAFFWFPQRPIVVVDLDGTVCASSELEVGLNEPAELKAVEGAPEALREIAKRCNILYLTARDDALMNRTREWLDLRGFPKGPALFRDLKLTNLSAESYKTARLKEMKKTWNLVAGVGDRDEDADAYMAAGMTAYLIGKPTKIPQGARKLVSWSEIERLLRPE